MHNTLKTPVHHYTEALCTHIMHTYHALMHTRTYIHIYKHTHIHTSIQTYTHT